MTDTKPGPCPFPDCGSKNTVAQRAISKKVEYYCMCKDCGSIGPGSPTKALAIAAWNATGEKIERLEDALQIAVVAFWRSTLHHKSPLATKEEIDEIMGKDFVTNLVLAQQKGGE